MAGRNGQPELIYNFTKELLIDLKSCYYQLIDNNFAPSGDKIFAPQANSYIDVNGMYLLTVEDLV